MGLRKKSIPWSEIHATHPYVHLSCEDKGARDYWRPQVPRGPYTDKEGKVIEDTTTPRLCFARHIGKAARAIGYQGSYLYVPLRDVAMKELNVDPPDSPGNRYGPNYVWSKYCAWKGVPVGEDLSILDMWAGAFEADEYHKEALKGCVPDANLTGEVWRTKPLHVRRIGTVNFSSRTVALE
jgi:hypothetical protein